MYVTQLHRIAQEVACKQAPYEGRQIRRARRARESCSEASRSRSRESASEASGTPSSPDCSRLVSLALGYTRARLARPEPNREPVRMLHKRKQKGCSVGTSGYGFFATLV